MAEAVVTSVVEAEPGTVLAAGASDKDASVLADGVPAVDPNADPNAVVDPNADPDAAAAVAAAAAAAADKDKTDAGAPEKYEFAAPEGVTLDAALVEKFEPIARELDLSQEQAQKFVGMYSEHIAALNGQAQTELVTKRAEWAAEFRKAGDWKEQAGLARRAINNLADEDTQRLFLGSWLGDHPGILKLLASAGKLISEDRGKPGGSTSPAAKSAADIMYPSLAKK